MNSTNDTLALIILDNEFFKKQAKFNFDGKTHFYNPKILSDFQIDSKKRLFGWLIRFHYCTFLWESLCVVSFTTISCQVLLCWESIPKALSSTLDYFESIANYLVSHPKLKYPYTKIISFEQIFGKNTFNDSFLTDGVNLSSSANEILAEFLSSLHLKDPNSRNSSSLFIVNQSYPTVLRWLMFERPLSSAFLRFSLRANNASPTTPRPRPLMDIVTKPRKKPSKTCTIPTI